MNYSITFLSVKKLKSEGKEPVTPLECINNEKKGRVNDSVLCMEMTRRVSMIIMIHRQRLREA